MTVNFLHLFIPYPFHSLGAKVIMACRDVEKAETTASEIRKHFEVATSEDKKPGEVLIKKLDLASFKSIRDCAQDINQTEANVHILINNAGEWPLNLM
jgi:Short-chain dehydrogenases of various substrate specificities